MKKQGRLIFILAAILLLAISACGVSKDEHEKVVIELEQAKAELEQAALRYEATRQNIMLQVQRAYTQYISAHEQFDLWSSNIIPTLEQAVEQARGSYEAGEVSLILVLYAQKELLKARLRLTELVARLNSSKAELNFYIGKKMI